MLRYACCSSLKAIALGKKPVPVKRKSEEEEKHKKKTVTEDSDEGSQDESGSGSEEEGNKAQYIYSRCRSSRCMYCQALRCS